MSFPEALREAYRVDYEEAEHETADFLCEVCDAECLALPMRAFLDFGEPDCPHSHGPMTMTRVHRKKAI